jgi:hypothetical protein
MRQLGRPIGLLFCKDGLVPFYERLGWRAIATEVTVDQPAGPVPMPLRTCWTTLSANPRLPSGPLSSTVRHADQRYWHVPLRPCQERTVSMGGRFQSAIIETTH